MARKTKLVPLLALWGWPIEARAQATSDTSTAAAPVEPAAAPEERSPVAAPPASPSMKPQAAPVAAVPRPPTPAPPSPAPECVPPDEPSEGAGAFFLGLGFFDFSDLNHHLRQNGYEAIDMPLTMLGGEGHAVLPSGFVIGARGGALLSADGGGPDGLRRTFSGGFGMADFGYAFLREQAVLITLTSGIGGYGMELGIGDGQSVPFDQVLQNPRRSSSVGRGGLLVGLTLGVDGRVSVGPAKDGGQGFFTLGARIGALYGPPLGSWSLSEGGDATGGPGPGLAGGYAALAVGFGGGRERGR
jgi:hypothetical protein